MEMIKNCLFCEKEFSSNYVSAKYCCRKCSNNYHYQLSRKTKNTDKCIHCGKDFLKRANKNNTCIDCKKLKVQGVKPDLNVELRNRDNTDVENKMIQDFLKGVK